MAADTGQNAFRRGVMSLVILALLKQEDMYGYQLVQQTAQSSGGRIVTRQMVEDLVYLCNGHFFKGTGRLIAHFFKGRKEAAAFERFLDNA